MVITVKVIAIAVKVTMTAAANDENRDTVISTVGEAAAVEGSIAEVMKNAKKKGSIGGILPVGEVTILRMMMTIEKMMEKSKKKKKEIIVMTSVEVS
mmetsp:Transcript_24076/g.50805  ORF Transcript_24076/g.50805 Transcript_24076/m.50805 type:complete len:97 (-) Transcript_24076:86-376(-)